MAPKQILIRIDDREIEFDQDVFYEQFGIKGLVRIPIGEYSHINMSGEYFTNFNLNTTTNQTGNKYLLLPILRSGRYANGSEPEKQPLLSLDGARFVECLEVQNHIPLYGVSSAETVDVVDFFQDPAVFKYSMDNIQSRDSLCQALYNRYNPIQGVTLEQVAKSEVSMSKFKFGEKFDLEILKF